MDIDIADEKTQYSEEDINKLADFFSVLIEIEQDLKKKGISLDDL